MKQIPNLLMFCFSLLALAPLAEAVPGRNIYDFNNDQRSDLVLWSPGTAAFKVMDANSILLTTKCGAAGGIPLVGDSDGDGVSEFAVWQAGPVINSVPTTAYLTICKPNDKALQIPLGAVGDLPLYGVDFDGDGVTDISVFRPTTGEWFESLSTTGQTIVTKFGQLGDIAIPADFDGDGLADLAVYRVRDGSWRIRFSTSGKKKATVWGRPSDIPVPADYDGDLRADVAVYRPETGKWLILPSSLPGQSLKVTLGLPGDRPYPLDRNGDGKAEIAVVRPVSGLLFVLPNPQAKWKVSRFPKGNYLLANQFRPQIRAVNDFNGDGVSDYAVIRRVGANLAWFVADKTRGLIFNINWGLVGDLALSTDFTLDGQNDFVVIRPINGSLNWFIRPSDPSLPARSTAFGALGDTLVPADYDGDRKVDFAVVRTSPDQTLLWLIQSSLTGQLIGQPWGLAGDQVVVADFSGDGTDDPTVVRNIGGYLYWFSADLRSRTSLRVVQWGLFGDTLLAYDFDGDNRTDYAVARSIGGVLYLFIRLANGTIRPPIPWGVPRDTYVPGHYLGGYKTWPAVWHANPATGQESYYVRKGALGAYRFPWGLKGDFPVRDHQVINTLAPAP